MKKTILYCLAFLFLGTSFVACNKDRDISDDDALIKELSESLNLVEVDVADLPESTQSFLEEVQFDTYVEQSYELRGEGFRCNMGSGDILFFDRNGRHLILRHRRGRHFGPHGPCHPRPGVGFGHGLPIEDLSTDITDYITENYPDSELMKARAHQDGDIIIGLRPFVLLKFDADGNFIEELMPIHNCHRPCNRLALEELPTAISDNISADFPDAVFKVACERGDKIVIFMRTEDGRLILGYNAETGELIFQRG